MAKKMNKKEKAKQAELEREYTLYKIKEFCQLHYINYRSCSFSLEERAEERRLMEVGGRLYNNYKKFIEENPL